ncbi:MAG TPA: helix-turn-helix domain-containing protein [Bacillota bacterium]|nr:helix-turn-helix domain-containing protein [Bacillota bacterium]
MPVQSANYSQFKQYSTFTSIEELNLTIRHFLYLHSHELTPATVKVFKTISKYACKILGVCFAKVSSLSTIIGISERTIRRAFIILEQHGVLKRIPTQRKQGGDGHNLYVIQPYVSAVGSAEMSDRQSPSNQDETSPQPTQNDAEAISFKTEHSNREISNNVQTDDNGLPSSYTPSYVPETFRKAISAHFNNAKIIYTLWQKSLLAYRQSRLNAPIEGYIDNATQAFRDSVFALKTNRIKGSFAGYYYGTLRNVFAVEKRREVDYTPCWLES